MKLIIDIPEEEYKDLVDDKFFFVQHLVDAIKNGTPIPDNATMLSVTEWADKCRECGSEQGRKLKQIRADR